jgi:threonine dehydrogenase-like Zn-dependent dehydrogenase
MAGEYIAVFGAGPIGLLAAMTAKNMGAHPILIDIVPLRLEKAKSLGVQLVIDATRESVIEQISNFTNGRMAEVVLEASGANEAIVNCLHSAAHAGRVVLTGWPKHATTLDTAIITRKELDVRGSRTANLEFQDSLNAIANGSINMAAVLTQTCPFEALPEMLVSIAEKPEQYLKVVAMTS